MPSFPIVNASEDMLTFWPLQSYALSKNSRSNQPSQIYLDRTNAEFGIIYTLDTGLCVLADAPDTDEPVYFQVSHTRAVCSRSNQACKKVCVLLQNSQLDLEFKNGESASDFQDTLCRLANKVGNAYFEIFEAPS